MPAGFLNLDRDMDKSMHANHECYVPMNKFYCGERKSKQVGSVAKLTTAIQRQQVGNRQTSSTDRNILPSFGGYTNTDNVSGPVEDAEEELCT